MESEFVLLNSSNLPEGVSTKVVGYDFNKGIHYDQILKSYMSTGIQATNFAKAVEVINSMIQMREIPLDEAERYSEMNPIKRERRSCTIFLGYTSNMISSGIRETIRFLAQHNLVDVIVTSAGGVEEDIIKCIRPSFIGDFNKFNDASLRKNGINRIGNMLVPNDNYVEFEQWLMPLFDSMLDEQERLNVNWTPSKFIERIGKEINNEESVYYWCWRNNIPVFCPALTDGSIGDMLYFHSIRNPGLRIDLVEDIRCINKQAVSAISTGMIILGGGVVKHHIANANLMRNGSDFSVYINTGNEFEASDSGAPPSEAISWGKIKSISEPVKLFCEASLVFPLIVAQTFAKHIHEKTHTFMNGQVK